MSGITTRPAVFVDRDKTLIEDPGYISHPNQVSLLDGAGEAIALLRDAGYAVIVVTNQSGVARGLFTEDDLAAIHQRMRDLLRARGADVDAVYYCPYWNGPEAVRDGYRRDSNLRKPEPGMLLLAARELGIDLDRSWMVGDSPRDVQAGRAAGCRTVLIGHGSQPDASEAEFVTADLPAAAEYILAQAEHPTMQEQGKNEAQQEVRPPPEADRHGPPQQSALDTRSQPPATERKAPDESRGSIAEETLGRILEELRMIRREHQYVDFSIGRLAGAVAQAFAICAVGWGLYAWISGGPGPDPQAATSATIRLLAGIAFQLIALTCFAAASKK